MRKPKGFTLLEFILYFALLALVMTAVTSFTLGIIMAEAKGRVIAEVEFSNRLALSRILRTVRTADAYISASSTLDNDNGVLGLNMGQGASNNPTIFDLSASGTIRVKEGSASATPLTTSYVNVTKLRFSKDNQANGNVTITAEIGGNYVNPGTDRTFSYTSSTSGTAMIRKQGN